MSSRVGVVKCNLHCFIGLGLGRSFHETKHPLALPLLPPLSFSPILQTTEAHLPSTPKQCYIYGSAGSVNGYISTNNGDIDALSEADSWVFCVPHSITPDVSSSNHGFGPGTAHHAPQIAPVHFLCCLREDGMSWPDVLPRDRSRVSIY